MPLSLLMALSAEQPVSGERLAEQFHCTRAAIAKRVSNLRSMGVLINALPRVGYQLGYPYEWWSELAITALPLLPAQCHLLPKVDSTNTWMRERIRNDVIGSAHLAITDFQYAGQGRRGREWLSLPGRQITASIGLVSAQSPVAWLGVAIAVGVSIATTLNRLGWPVMLKWPNDLWLNGAKLGGILVEMDAMAEGPSRLVIGFGINEALLDSERAELARPVAALKDHGVSYSRHALLLTLSTDLLSMLKKFSMAGLAPWRAAWEGYDALAGQSIGFDYQGELREGVARGIDEQGALLVQTQQQMLRCHSGEVSVRALP